MQFWIPSFPLGNWYQYATRDIAALYPVWRRWLLPYCVESPI